MNFKSILSTIILVLKKHTAIDLSKKIDTHNSIPFIESLIYPVLGLLIGFVLFFLSLFKLIYSPLFVSFISVCIYLFITKAKHFIALANFAQQSIQKFIHIENNTIYNKCYENINDKNFIYTIIFIAYMILFSVSKSSALLIAPMLAYLVPCTSSLLFEINYDECSMISSFAENKAFSYIAFILSFILAIVIHTKYAISLAIIYIILIYVIKYLNKTLESLPKNFEHILIESIFIAFLLISYLLFL